MRTMSQPKRKENIGGSSKEESKGVVQDIMVIMDKSGSMASMGAEPLQALNSFIKEQQDDSNGAKFSLWMFDTVARLIIDDQPLQDVAPITDYVPDGMTAMYDAIGKAVSLKYSKDKSDNVICMVITDGCENSSREFRTTQIRDLISRAESDKNWKFIFVGAADIFAEGAKAGFEPSRCAAYLPSRPGTLQQLTRGVSQTVAQYRSVTSTGVTCDLNLRQQTAPAVMTAFKDSDTDDDTTTAAVLPVPPPPPAAITLSRAASVTR